MPNQTKPDTRILTPETLAEIEARASAATDGPWLYDDRNSAVIEQVSGGESWIVQSWSKQEESFVDERENGEFIAHARTDIPALCQTVRAAWQDLADDHRILSGAVREAESNRDGAVRLVESLRQRLTVKSDLLDKAMAQALELDTQNADLRAQLVHVEQERDLAYADGYSNGIRHGKQSRAPVAACANCGHANPHDGPAGTVDDHCTEPGCNCGYYQPVAATVNDEGDANLYDEMERNAMIETIKELERERDELRARLGTNGSTHPTFKNTKGAMLYAQRNNLPAVLPAAAPAPPAQPATSGAAWRRWFDRLGDKASAEIVNATADLVCDERLAALVQAKVLPTPSPTDNEEAK